MDEFVDLVGMDAGILQSMEPLFMTVMDVKDVDVVVFGGMDTLVPHVTQTFFAWSGGTVWKCSWQHGALGK